MVNAALYLRRPLLVTGRPAPASRRWPTRSPTSSQLGQVLRWPINSRSTFAEGLYRYDAIARLRDASLATVAGREHPDDSTADAPRLDVSAATCVSARWALPFCRRRARGSC